MRVCSVPGVCVLAVVVSVAAAALPPLGVVEAAAQPSKEYLEENSSLTTDETEDLTDSSAEPSMNTPTDAPTEPPTDPPTEPPTDPPTEPPTDPPTEPPTDPPTEPPTDPPTEPPTDPPTEPPTDPPTEPPTDPPTEPPTDPPTEPPTDPPTEPPTSTTPEPTEPPIPVPTAAPPRTHKLTVGDLGTAEGVILTSFKSRDFYGFMSLPYAEPPVNELRFKYPKEFTGPWNNSYYDASYLRPRCAQASLLFTGIVSGSEDCLHLSVYTPLLPEDLTEREDALPVMVFIHGGAYMSGDAFLYVPTKLMDRDVVVVVVQYRLGLLGFLAAGVEGAPGNMGLMDQITALRWVQKHIHHFAGDPNLVTVFGQSAGGASSSWMYITPLTNASAEGNNGRQLLHRVIPQSGSALEEWTLDKDPKTSFAVAASKLKCDVAGFTTEDMVSCMKSRPYEDVVNAAVAIYIEDRRAGGLGFKGLSPVVQRGIEGIDPVIPKDPREILDAGEFLPIPVMTGSVRDEGSLVMGLTYKDFMVYNNHTTEDVDFLKNDALMMLLQAFGIEDKTGSVSSSMKITYLPDATMGDWDSMIGGMIDMSGVMFLKSGLWELTRRASLANKNSPIYFYSWEYEADDTLFDWIFMSFPNIPVPGGICHADELLYLFHLPAVHDERQKVMVDRMTKIWTDFAKYGDPTPEATREQWEGAMEKWEPYDPSQQNFMLIKDTFTMTVDFTTRWKYHSTTHSNSTAMPPSSTITPTMPPDMVSRDAYNDVKKERDNFTIATCVLGALCAFCLLLFVVIYIRKRRKQNAIV